MGTAYSLCQLIDEGDGLTTTGRGENARRRHLHDRDGTLINHP